MKRQLLRRLMKPAGRPFRPSGGIFAGAEQENYMQPRRRWGGARAVRQVLARRPEAGEACP